MGSRLFILALALRLGAAPSFAQAPALSGWCFRAWCRAEPDLAAPITPVVPVCFRHGIEAFNFFSAVTVLGTPQNITLQELRIECFFPSDAETTAAARRLATQ